MENTEGILCPLEMFIMSVVIKVFKINLNVFLYQIAIKLICLFQFYILKLNLVKRDNHKSL